MFLSYLSICPSCSNNPTKSCVIRKQELRTPAQIAEKAKKHEKKKSKLFALKSKKSGSSPIFRLHLFSLKALSAAKLKISKQRSGKVPVSRVRQKHNNCFPFILFTFCNGYCRTKRRARRNPSQNALLCS